MCVCVCVLVWSGGKEEGKQRMLNKIINSCHWRERRVEEREREKSTLGASSQRRTEGEEKGGQLESFRETLRSSGNVPQPACGDLILTSRRKISSQNSVWMDFLQVQRSELTCVATQR